MRCWMTEQNQLTFADSSLRKCQAVYRFCSSRLVKAIAGRKQPVRRNETEDDKQTWLEGKTHTAQGELFAGSPHLRRVRRCGARAFCLGRRSAPAGLTSDIM